MIYFKISRTTSLPLLLLSVLINISVTTNASEKQLIEAESAKLIAGATKISDSNASKGLTVSLTKSGDGILFSKLPAAKKVAICYASVNVGTISLVINGQLERKINVHSSGALNE